MHRIWSPSSRLAWLVVALALLAAALPPRATPASAAPVSRLYLPSAALNVAPPSAIGAAGDVPAATGRTFYVSKAGNNADGRGWASAWNELDQIRWDQLRPGDTVA